MQGVQVAMEWLWCSYGCYFKLQGFTGLQSPDLTLSSPPGCLVMEWTVLPLQ
jgi:hypothetical protein